MNLNNIMVKKALDDEDRATLRDALRTDEVIVPAILKLLEARLLECKPTLTMLNDVSYVSRRAAKDGAQLELEWLVKIFTEDKFDPTKKEKRNG